MAQRIRFKRHVRFLEAEGKVRSLSTKDEGVELPGGEAFQRMLAAIVPMPEADRFMAVLAGAMGVEEELVQALADRLFATGLIEVFDDSDTRHDLFDRQLHFFDVLAPVTDHAGNIARQQRLADAQVLVLGLGGIGHQVALSLAAAGVGSLVLVDGDTVEESNLHRQVLFARTDTGRPKVEAAADGVRRVAPGCAVVVRRAMITAPEEWVDLIAAFPNVRHVMISADRPLDLVGWISAQRSRFNYHAIKCGYMGVQGIIGPLLGPDTPGYDDLFDSWAPLIASQCAAVARINDEAVAPTMAASNAIMANIAALELIKHITGAGALTLLGRRMLLDLRDYSTTIG